MSARPRLRRRLLEHAVGLSIGAGIFYWFERQYQVHEAGLLSMAVFDPPGIKYAYARPPEPGRVRGWVYDMSPPAKRPGVRRIIALGDSITYGLGVSLEDAWPAALERAIPNSEVFNLAICGWDAEQVVSLATTQLNRWQPDLVVWGSFPNDVLPTYLMWGANDKHPVFVGTSIPDNVGFLPEFVSIPILRHSALFRQYLANRLAQAQQAGLNLAADMPWYEDQLSQLGTWSTTNGVPVIVLAISAHTQAAPDRCTERISEHDCQAQAQRYRVLTETLEASGLKWVDGQRVYAASGRPHFMVLPGETAGPGAWENDAEHPTAAGHDVLAAGLVPAVSEALQR